MPGGLDLTGRVALNATPAINSTRKLASSFVALAADSKTTNAELSRQGKAFIAAARAADIERNSIAKVAKAQAAVNKEISAGIVLQQRATAVNRESLAKSYGTRVVAKARAGQIVGATENATAVTEGRVALNSQRALTEEVRRTALAREAESKIQSRAVRDQIAQQRLAMSQQRAANAALNEGKLGLTGYAYGLQNVSTNLRRMGTIGVGAFAALAYAGISGQRELANVVRTTADLTKGPKDLQETTARLTEQFNALAETLPVSYKELTEIGTAAGQLGIPAENIAGFTKTVAQFSATSNVSTDQAATAFGRLDSLIPDVQHNYQGLADSILNVGVTSVATESQIINIASQISGIAASAGLSAKEIVGFSGALASVNVSPYLARGLVTRLFGDISSAVSEGGTALEKFGILTHQSGQAFAQSWRSDKTGALLSIFDAIRKAGPNAQQALANIGITSKLDVPALVRLANASNSAGAAGQLLAQSFDKAANSGGTLSRQYAIINNTIGAKLQVVLNTIGVALRTIAATDMGPLGSTIDQVMRSVILFTQSLNEPVTLLGSFKLPFTNAEALGFVGIAAAIIGALSLLASGLTATASAFIRFDQVFLGSRASHGLSNFISGAGAARTATTKLTTTMTTSTGPIGNFFNRIQGGAKQADGSFLRLNNSITTFGGRSAGVLGKVESGFNRASAGLSKFASAFGPELVAIGGVALLATIADLDSEARKLGSDAAVTASAMMSLANAGKVVSSINVNKGGFLTSDIQPFVKNIGELKRGLDNLGTDKGIVADATNSFKDMIGFFIGGNTNEGFNNMTTGLSKLNEGFNQIASSQGADVAVADIQKIFKGVSDKEAQAALNRMPDVMSALTIQLQQLGVPADKINADLPKMLNGTLNLSKGLQVMADSTVRATQAFEGDETGASQFVDAVNNAYTSAVDFNKGYQSVLDSVNASAKKKWVAAGNDVSTFKETAVADLNDFFATMNKQVDATNAFQSNVATIMQHIGNEYGVQLEALPPEIAAQVVKGGDKAMDTLRDLFDKQKLGPIIAANMAEAADNPTLYDAFRNAGGKSRKAFDDALISGQNIDDVIKGMTDKLNSGVSKDKILIKIHGDTVPAQKDGESLVAYLDRLDAYVKTHGDTTFARKDFADLESYTSNLQAFIKAYGDTAPARADFATVQDYIDGLQVYMSLHGDTIPLRRDGESAAAYVSRLEATLKVQANGAPARKSSQDTAAYINTLKGTITALGFAAPARRAGEGAKAYIDRLNATIDVLANGVPARTSSQKDAEYIDTLKGTITALGDTAPARGASESAAHYIDRLRGTITADAATADANDKLDYAARDRTSVITAKFNGGGGGFATGGLVRGPGTGTSDSIPINVSDGEYVVRAEQARKFRSLLDRINYGPVKGYATGGTVTGGSSSYESTAASYSSRDKSRGSVINVTELSAYDRHLLMLIAERVGFTITNGTITNATNDGNGRQSRRGNG